MKHAVTTQVYTSSGINISTFVKKNQELRLKLSSAHLTKLGMTSLHFDPIKHAIFNHNKMVGV